MPADPAAPVTEPRHSCGPDPELVETAARELHRSWNLGKRRRGWFDLTDMQRASYRRVACDVLTEVLDEHEQQIRAKVAGEIETHGGEYVAEGIRAGVQTWPRERAIGYGVGIDEAAEVARGTEGGTR